MYSRPPQFRRSRDWRKNGGIRDDCMPRFYIIGVLKQFGLDMLRLYICEKGVLRNFAHGFLKSVRWLCHPTVVVLSDHAVNVLVQYHNNDSWEPRIATTYIKIFWGIYPDLFWIILNYSDLFWFILIYSDLFWFILICFNLFWWICFVSGHYV